MITPAYRSNIFELRVMTSLAHINWLPPNFDARNDLISVFHQTLTLAKGRAVPDYLTPLTKHLCPEEDGCGV